MKNIENSHDGSAKAVLEITSLSGGSGVQRDGVADIKAISFLQAAGFVGLKGLKTGISARVPGGNTLFLLEHDTTPADSKHFRILRLSGESSVEVETGYTIYIQKISGSDRSFEVLGRGDTLKNWELNCNAINDETFVAYKKICGRNGFIPNKNEDIPEATKVKSKAPPAVVDARLPKIVSKAVPVISVLKSVTPVVVSQQVELKKEEPTDGKYPFFHTPSGSVFGFGFSLSTSLS